MKSVVMRTVALVLLAGQLQALPAGLACVREHRRPAGPAHCEDSGHGVLPSGVSAASITATPDAAATLCGLLGPCAVPTPAVAQAAVVAGIAGEVRGAASTTPAVPRSIDLSPQPPPPLA